MYLLRPIVLLFLLNFFDAVLTVFWVRNGFASEGNHLMASLLDIGDFPFLAVKLAVGLVTAFVLWRWSEKRLAKIGLTLALTVYIGLMGVHFITGLSAFGLISQNFIENFAVWTKTVFAFFF
jgi:hypothetical protein